MYSQHSMPEFRPPRAKSGLSRKLRFIIFLFFISIFLLILFHSPLSKVTSVEMSGFRFTGEASIRQAVDIYPGDLFFAVSLNKAREQVLELDLIEDVNITREFPGKIVVTVKEYDHVAFEIKDGELFPVLANGRIVAPESGRLLPDKPILNGWGEYDDLKHELCMTLVDIPSDRLADVSEIWPDPTPSYLDRIILYTQSSFEITTTIEKLPEKMEYYHELIDELHAQGETEGRLVLLEADTFIPYDLDEADHEQPESGT